MKPISISLPDEFGHTVREASNRALMDYLKNTLNARKLPVDTFGVPHFVMLSKSRKDILFMPMSMFHSDTKRKSIMAIRSMMDAIGEDVCAFVSEAYLREYTEDEFNSRDDAELEDDHKAREALIILVEQRGCAPLLAKAFFGDDGIAMPLKELEGAESIGGELSVFGDIVKH